MSAETKGGIGKDDYMESCLDFGVDRELANDIWESVKNPNCLLEAAELLTPRFDAVITNQLFSEVWAHRLIREDLADRPFPKVLTRRLQEVAGTVVSLANELKLAVDELIELGIPATLSDTTDGGITGSLHEDFMIALPDESGHLPAIAAIAQNGLQKFKSHRSREYLPLNSPQDAFARTLARIWMDAGHKVTTTKGGKFCVFLECCFAAATGRDYTSVSRVLTAALDEANKAKDSPLSLDARKKRAEVARHRLTFLKKYRHRPQLAPLEQGTVRSDSPDDEGSK